MSKVYVEVSRVYSSYQMDIRSKAFKLASVTHQNAVTTAVMRTLKTNDCDGREREEMLKEDLEKNVSTTFTAEIGKLM